MPLILKKIDGHFLENYTVTLTLASLSGTIQNSDYINVNGLIVFIQNYNNVNQLSKIRPSIMYGLKNKTKVINIELSY